MSDQGSLFDPPAPAPVPTARRTDPPTAHAAAHLATVNAATNRALALQAHQDHPQGLTDFELADLTGIPQTSIGVRRHELVNLGYIAPLIVNGKRVTRPAPSGSPAQVWRIK